MTRQITGYRRLFTPELVAVLFVCCIAFFAGEVLTPILPLYLSSLGLDARTIGLMFSIMMVGIAISEVFWGWVVDRVDLRIAIFMGTVMYGTIISTLNFAKTLPVLAVVVFIYGFCRSPIFIVGRWFMGVHAPNDMKAFAMALLGTAIGLVQTLGGFTSGYITQAGGYRFTFWLAAGLAISAGVIILIAGRWLNFQNHKQAQDKTELKVQKAGSISREVKLLTLSLGIIGTLYFVSFGIFNTYLPLYASEVVHAETSLIGNLFGVRGLISTLAMIPLGRLADRKSKWFFLPLGMVLVALSMAGIAYSGSYMMLLVTVILFALGSAIYLPLGTAILSQSIPVFWTGTAMGIYGFMEDVGWMIGPAIGGVLWVSWSQHAPFLFAGCVALVSIPLLIIGRHRLSNVVINQQKLEVEPEIRA
jgi:MFS family permease